MPPWEPLVSAHGFWLLVIGPIVIAGLQRFSVANLRWLGIGFTVLGLVMLASVIGYEICTWTLGYWPQRIILVIATWIELPMVETLIAGLICWCVATRRARRALAANQDGELDDLWPELSS